VSTRAFTPVIGIVLLLGVTVLAAATVGAGLLGTTPSDGTPPRVSLTASANASADRIALTHTGGDVITVSRLRVRISVDGQRLEQQPPVPFFAATGFEAGPTGPFNTAADQTWGAGERATLSLAGTNSPQLTPGATVRVDIYRGEYRIATVTTRAA
jgi:FlaG/FlaF family flagellin (archaellin)